jgi:hypothetical protein
VEPREEVQAHGTVVDEQQAGENDEDLTLRTIRIKDGENNGDK